MQSMQRSFVLVLTLTFGLFPSLKARAAEPDSGPPSVRVEPIATPAGLLAAADAAVGARNLSLACALYQRLVAQFPATPEASEARRALAIIVLRLAPAESPSAPAPAATANTPNVLLPSQDDDVVVRNESYSLKTLERLRLTIWEKVDFSVTSFLYGMSVGFSLSLSQDAQGASEVLTPVAIGAVAYTLGSIAFLKLANPDRGDLALALAITSYVPMTTLLVMSAVHPNPSVKESRNSAAATALTGLLSIPIAVLAARHFTLDPGDTQLVRDAGFWGMALSTLGTLGFGGSDRSESYGYSYYDSPSGRTVAVAGLLGLYGGLGLGLLGARVGEVSLERVRVTTWGGYGGAVVGLLLGASANNRRDQDMYRGAVVGALAGLVITFLLTGSLDGIPDEDRSRQSWHRRFTPMMVQVAGRDGRLHPGLGLGGSLF